MKTIRLALISFAILSLPSCDNTKNISDSREKQNTETTDLESIKKSYSDSLETLKSEVQKISQEKESVSGSKKFSESKIYNIIKNGYLDHIIIGTDDLKQSYSFFSEVLGFKVKKGTKHKTGISNIFIEFSDSSEIEIIEVNNPADKLTLAYDNEINDKNFGLQFAIRVNKIDLLYNHFKNLSSNYSSFIESDSYSTLSKKNINEGMPIFFIEQKSNSLNKFTNHENKALGINSIWLGRKELKKDILELVDYGFELKDTIRIPGINKKSYLMSNNNFKINLFQNDTDKIEGVSIRMEDQSYLRKRLEGKKLTFEERTDQDNKVIILSPETTNSVYLEFIQ